MILFDPGTVLCHEMEVTMVDPKSLPESDPQRHTMQVRSRSTELAEHLREDVEKVEEPGFKALFETAAEVLAGLEKAIAGYERYRLTHVSNTSAFAVRPVKEPYRGVRPLRKE